MLLQEVVKDGAYVFNQETLRIAVPCREDVLNEVFLRHRGAVSYSVSKKQPCRNLELFVKRKKIARYLAMSADAGNLEGIKFR